MIDSISLNLSPIFRIIILFSSIAIYFAYQAFYWFGNEDENPKSWSTTYYDIDKKYRWIFQVWIFTFSILLGLAGNNLVWFVSSALMIVGVAFFPTIKREKEHHLIYHMIGAITSVITFITYILIVSEYRVYLASILVSLFILAKMIYKESYIRGIENICYVFACLYILINIITF